MLFGLFGLLFALAVLTVVLTEVWPRGRFLGTYGPNLAIEFLGILITVVLVERLLAWQRDVETRPLKAAAARGLGRVLDDFVFSLTRSYVAAAEPYRDPTGEDVPGPLELDAFLASWRTEMGFLDLSSTEQCWLAESWLAEIGAIFSQANREIRAEIDRVGYLLDHDLLIALEDLLDEHAFVFLAGIPLAAENAKDRDSLGRVAEGFLGTGRSSGPPALVELTRRIRRVCDRYETVARPVIPWHFHYIYGQWGAARRLVQ